MEKRRVPYTDEDGNSREAWLYDNEPHDGVESPEGHYHIEIIPAKNYICEFLPERYYLCVMTREYTSESLFVVESLLKDFMEEEGAEIPTDMAVPFRHAENQEDTRKCSGDYSMKNCPTCFGMHDMPEQELCPKCHPGLACDKTPITPKDRVNMALVLNAQSRAALLELRAAVAGLTERHG